MALQSSNRKVPLIVLGVLVLIGCGAIAVVVGLYFLRQPEPANTEPTVAYILDVSPRMGPSAERKDRLQIARGILANVVRRADPELTAGLRVFGTDRVATVDCEDTELLVPFAKANRDRVATRFSELEIGGSTESALGEAMITSIRDLKDEEGPRYMVVVTGGPDSCNPDAGRLIGAEAERAGINLQTFLVGFQVSPLESDALRRMAEQIAGGMYLEAADAEELRRVLESIQRFIEQGDPIELEEAAGPISAPEEEEPDDEPQPEVPMGDALAYESQTACDHPYFPLRTGAHWDYSYDGTPASWDVTSISGDLVSATATVVVQIDPVTITYTWDCGTDGVFYYQSGLFDFSELGENVEIVLTSQSGSPIPPAVAFQPGGNWTSAYTMEIRIEVEGASFVITNEVEESHTAGAIQERTTTAGTFDVIPVTTSGTTTTSMPGNSFTNTSSGTCWFALGVGWLGCEMSSAGETSVSELVGFSIP
jgi:hypothetical protein